MKRIKLIVSYDGTNYCGWQIQPNGITIEEVLNKTISSLIKEDVKVVGASRTDSGVHALGNVAVFDSSTTIPPERIMYALNQLLPKDIVVTHSEEVTLDWHPRYRKSVKTYEYRIQTGTVYDPIYRYSHYFVSYHLDFKAMEKATKYLVGEHDFAGFTREENQERNTLRTIYEAGWTKSDNILVFTIKGNGFLYNMVRMIVGMLLQIGMGNYQPEYIKEILDSKGDGVVKLTAQPQGLILKGIRYED